MHGLAKGESAELLALAAYDPAFKVERKKDLSTSSLIHVEDTV
jgi:hypothetical protein